MQRAITARTCYIRKLGPRSEEPFTSEEWRILSERVRLSIWRVGEAILYVQRLAQLFGDDLAVIVRFRYTGLRGRALVHLEGTRVLFGDRRSEDDAVLLET